MSNDNSISSIFILPVQDKYLLYAPLHELSALLNGAAVLQVKQALAQSNPDSATPELSDLISTLQAPPTRNPNRSGELEPQFLGIIPSRRSNMSCFYCDFGVPQTPGELIAPDIVVAAIDYFASLTQQQNKQVFSIHFFGDDSLAEQEIIDIAVHHARFLGARTGLIPHFEMLSSGYFNEQQCVFIKDYFNRVVISFDGFPKYHDRTRLLNSRQDNFEKVMENLKYLSSSNIELIIRCCITAESVNDMEEMAQWLCAEFSPRQVNFETFTRNSKSEQTQLYPPEPYLFARNYVKSWRILRANKVNSAYAPISIYKLQATSCLAGQDALIVHPDGLVASCYMHRQAWEDKQLDLSVGKVHENGRMDIDFDKIKQLRNLSYSRNGCENCFCQFGCNGNCYVNSTYPGSAQAYTDFCLQTRIIIACLLLEEMGQQSIVDNLLNDDNALKNLALYKSDNLFDFKG